MWVTPCSSNETGTTEVYVRPFPDVAGGQWQVSRTGGEEPRWGPQGRELFYRATTGALMRVSIEGESSELMAGAPEELFAGTYLFGLGRPTWDISPDGRRFLLADVGSLIPEGKSIAVVDNWFEELERLAPRSDAE